MIVLVAILDSIAKKSSCFHCFPHGASLHHNSFIFALTFFYVHPVIRACACQRHALILKEWLVGVHYTCIGM